MLNVYKSEKYPWTVICIEYVEHVLNTFSTLVIQTQDIGGKRLSSRQHETLHQSERFTVSNMLVTSSWLKATRSTIR